MTTLDKKPLEPTESMLVAGARRLLSFEDDLSDTAHTPLQWRGAKNDAERVWRSMWLQHDAETKPPGIEE